MQPQELFNPNLRHYSTLTLGILQPFYACDAALPVVLADGSNFSQRHQDMFNSLEEAFQVHQEVATADKLQEH